MTKTGDNHLIHTPPGPADPGALGAGRPMTEETRAKLMMLCRKTGEEMDENLTERQAKLRIAALEDELKD